MTVFNQVSKQAVQELCIYHLSLTKGAPAPVTGRLQHRQPALLQGKPRAGHAGMRPRTGGIPLRPRLTHRRRGGFGSTSWPAPIAHGHPKRPPERQSRLRQAGPTRGCPPAAPAITRSPRGQPVRPAAGRAEPVPHGRAAGTAHCGDPGAAEAPGHRGPGPRPAPHPSSPPHLPPCWLRRRSSRESRRPPRRQSTAVSREQRNSAAGGRAASTEPLAPRYPAFS